MKKDIYQSGIVSVESTLSEEQFKTIDDVILKNALLQNTVDYYMSMLTASEKKNFWYRFYSITTSLIIMFMLFLFYRLTI